MQVSAWKWAKLHDTKSCFLREFLNYGVDGKEEKEVKGVRHSPALTQPLGSWTPCLRADTGRGGAAAPPIPQSKLGCR